MSHNQAQTLDRHLRRAVLESMDTTDMMCACACILSWGASAMDQPALSVSSSVSFLAAPAGDRSVWWLHANEWELWKKHSSLCPDSVSVLRSIFQRLNMSANWGSHGEHVETFEMVSVTG